jgi:hypothetical protein
MNRVDLQMMRRQLTAPLLLVQLVLALTALLTAMLAAALPAYAAGEGSISGHVFVDANGNGMAELGEAAVAGAQVSVVAQADAARTYQITTDAAGLFVLSGLEYGVYTVSATAGDKVAQDHTVIEIAEVNAQVLLDLPVYDSANWNVTVGAGRIFLPLLRP